MRSLIVALALAIAPVSSAFSQAASQASIEILSPWSPATPGGAKNGAAYLTIANKGKTDDRLVSVSTPIAETAEPHKTEDDHGVMKMVPVDRLIIKAGRKAIFRPGGYHVMLMGLKQPLKVGDTFPLAVIFEKAGKIEVTVKVMKSAPMGNMNM